MRKSIVETMALLVRKNGYEKTNIRDISEYLNIPRSLIYYYFKNKDDIMHVLYYERFSITEQLAEKVLPRGEEPLVRLMLKYLLYRRNIICDPLFAEYIATAPEYASRGKELFCHNRILTIVKKTCILALVNIELRQNWRDRRCY